MRPWTNRIANSIDRHLCAPERSLKHACSVRFGVLILLAAGGASASGPTAALFGAVTEDRGPFAAGGAYGAEGRLGWSFVDSVTFEAAAGFTRSQPQSWLLHVSLGPKLAFFTASPVSPYLRGNVGIGGRTPSELVTCAGSSCPAPRSADWTVAAAGAAGADFELGRRLRAAAEIGWRRFFFEDGRFPRDVRGLWLGFSFR
jgi:hypothetical protein